MLPTTTVSGTTPMDLVFDQCAEWVRQADGLLITAGAGLGVDSGLPDFRGSEGMWRAYPALGRAGLGFADIANPAAFEETPELAWGFYGHRLTLYRSTVPGPAFTVLRQLADLMPEGAFVYTSNVDGQFQTAGFAHDRVVECHGSIHHLQCVSSCTDQTWPADGFHPEVDADACQLVSPLPRCPHCGDLARPNILMFGDWDWHHRAAHESAARLQRWLRRLERPLVIELGAGTAIPSVRRFGERHAWRLIRINPREARVNAPGHLAVPLRAAAALTGIRDAVSDAAARTAW